ncbi:hypothetical protein RND71_029383 [Anisodus tanguticus]|uniref:Uncharacterized protein n=1 Tax=Anisodus tanguticus TaxID=243964 RepID=A0AAE1RED1_9SOLA|nr:hypothetical protein RND71_029383 [Anisodus tanguticus]
MAGWPWIATTAMAVPGRVATAMTRHERRRRFRFVVLNYIFKRTTTFLESATSKVIDRNIWVNKSNPSNIVAASDLNHIKGSDSNEKKNYDAYFDFNNIDDLFQNLELPSDNLPNKQDNEFDQVYYGDQVEIRLVLGTLQCELKVIVELRLGFIPRMYIRENTRILIYMETVLEIHSLCSTYPSILDKKSRFVPGNGIALFNR